MGALVAGVVVENRGVDVAGSVVGEAGEGVEITEGEVDEDVESSISLYNFEVVSSMNYLVHSLLCRSVPFHTSLNGSTCTGRTYSRMEETMHPRAHVL